MKRPQVGSPASSKKQRGESESLRADTLYAQDDAPRAEVERLVEHFYAKSGLVQPVAEDSDYDSDDASTARLTLEVQKLMRFFTISSSALFLTSDDGFKTMIDIFVDKFGALLHQNPSRDAIYSFFQAIRHVLGFVVVRKTGMPMGDDATSDSTQILLQLMLNLSLQYGMQGWSMDGKEKSTDIDELLQLVMSQDPRLISLWCSLSNNTPVSAGKRVWKAVVEILVEKRDVIQDVLRDSTTDYLSFVAAVRHIEAHNADKVISDAIIHKLRATCKTPPGGLLAAIRSAKAPLLQNLRRNIGKDRLGISFLVT